MNQLAEQDSENLAKIAESFAKIANVTENTSNKLLKAIIKKPFYKQATCWTAIIAATGLFGLIVTSQQQINEMRVSNIRKEIAALQNFDDKEVNAIVKERIVIINQTIGCKKNNIKTLLFKEKLRNKGLTNIVSTINLMPRDNDYGKIKKFESSIVVEMFDIKKNQICKININKFDNKIHYQQDEIENIINKKIEKYRRRERELENYSFL